MLPVVKFENIDAVLSDFNDGNHVTSDEEWNKPILDQIKSENPTLYLFIQVRGDGSKSRSYQRGYVNAFCMVYYLLNRQAECDALQDNDKK